MQCNLNLGLLSTHLTLTFDRLTTKPHRCVDQHQNVVAYLPRHKFLQLSYFNAFKVGPYYMPDAGRGF